MSDKPIKKPRNQADVRNQLHNGLARLRKENAELLRQNAALRKACEQAHFEIWWLQEIKPGLARNADGLLWFRAQSLNVDTTLVVPH
ncbi:MAG: hypothetical protein ACTHNM_17170 [Dyella sp.]|uniref:hypothetical protein n=1 Tax=Dyella sp. TaxID=1869338 RepID=UPI003F7F79D9